MQCLDVATTDSQRPKPHAPLSVNQRVFMRCDWILQYQNHRSCCL